MGKYPKHRKPAGLRKCPDCGQLVKARGMHGHRALVHNVVVKTIEKTRVNDLNTRVIDSSNNSYSDTDNKGITQVVSEISGKDMSECKRPYGKHLYTDQDLWILLSRISKVMLLADTGNLLSLWDSENTCNDLIRDFEQRFECKFSEVKQANQHIKPGKTDIENWDIASKYAHLKYSRSGGFVQEN
jgi:hypothetical protein